MLEHLFALIVFLHNPDGWKENIYDTKYRQVINKRLQGSDENIKTRESESLYRTIKGNISWYAKGKNQDGSPFDPTGLTTACWDEYPKGTKFEVSFNSNSVIVVCTDRGQFKQMGIMLDLSSRAFKHLAPLSVGIIRGAKIEIIK